MVLRLGLLLSVCLKVSSFFLGLLLEVVCFCVYWIVREVSWMVKLF